MYVLVCDFKIGGNLKLCFLKDYQQRFKCENLLLIMDISSGSELSAAGHLQLFRNRI
jgi:hypothetical protein